MIRIQLPRRIPKMKRQPTVLCTLIAALGLGLVMAQDQKAPTTTSDTPAARPAAPQAGAGEVEELAAIRAVANSFLDAYRAKDSAAIGALFTENAEIVDDDGEMTLGRVAIVERFTEIFKANESGKLDVELESIHLLSPGVAVEEGTATVSGDAGEKPETSRYSVIYVKQDGRWLQARIQDQTPSEETAHERLKDLEWMLGEWVTESDDELVSTTCSWSDNGSFLIRQFDVKIEGQVALSGTQRIGWDPLLKQFRTWVFDDEGGFAEGLVSHDDDDERWIVKSSGVRADGQSITATSVFRPLDPDRIGWQTLERSVGGVALPGFDEYVLVRKPPQPAP
jgi:uncharacterized protein (TIGR02246 family)